MAAPSAPDIREALRLLMPRVGMGIGIHWPHDDPDGFGINAEISRIVYDVERLTLAGFAVKVLRRTIYITRTA